MTLILFWDICKYGMAKLKLIKFSSTSCSVQSFSILYQYWLKNIRLSWLLLTDQSYHNWRDELYRQIPSLLFHLAAPSFASYASLLILFKKRKSDVKGKMLGGGWLTQSTKRHIIKQWQQHTISIKKFYVISHFAMLKTFSCSIFVLFCHETLTHFVLSSQKLFRPNFTAVEPVPFSSAAIQMTAWNYYHYYYFPLWKSSLTCFE